MILNKLSPDSIQEKIDLNAKQGIDIHKLKELIEQEKLDFEWVIIRATVQVQLYKEQLEYINKKIEETNKKEALNILEGMGE
jgi:hypothetical protein